MCQVNQLHLNKKCESLNDPIAVEIWQGEKKIGLCMKCWLKVADLEWETDKSQITFNEFKATLNREFDFTLTEYKLKGKAKEEEKDEE